MSDDRDRPGPRPGVRRGLVTGVLPFLVLRRHVDLCRTATALCRPA
ncbi:putative leader peptide [Pseudonocardia tropica]|uniref:Leader peptide n=1 Tax=Pseudonocardia tropica TaxID=681289 RepID=A0ABV1JSY8_9PSEU